MRALIIVAVLITSTVNLPAQEIKPEKGYSPQIGVLVSMLEDMKNRVERTVSGMSQQETDYLFDDNANSVGALVMHLAATEVFYQAYTFEGRELNAEEQAKWSAAQNLGDAAREKFKGKDIKEYLKEFDKVRERTLELLKTKDDDWLNEKIGNMNMHWAWYHVMEHQSSHLGQILLMRKRIPSD